MNLWLFLRRGCQTFENDSTTEELRLYTKSCLRFKNEQGYCKSSNPIWSLALYVLTILIFFGLGFWAGLEWRQLHRSPVVSLSRSGSYITEQRTE